jgi:hypothetical protein
LLNVCGSRMARRNRGLDSRNQERSFIKSRPSWGNWACLTRRRSKNC